MKHIVDYIKKNSWLLLIILPAMIMYLLIIFPSGSNYCYKEKCGIYFWGVHGHDAIWHLAIANTSFRSYPFIAASYAGAPLTGYNYLFDLIVYAFSLIGIQAIIFYFKIFPAIWFIFFTMLLIVLARKIKDSPLFVGLMLFFTYFAGSFSYFLTLYHRRTIWGAANLLATIPIHTMSNLQFACSLIILLTVLVIIKNKPNIRVVLILCILNFINLGIKFYGGALTTFLISIYLFFNMYKRSLRKLLLYFLINGLLITLALLFFYDPFTATRTGSIFSFSPFALIHTVTEEPTLFYMKKLTDARYFLMTRGIGLRLILIELFNLTAFLFFYLGVRFFGLIYIIFLVIRRKIDKFNLYILATILLAILLTCLFVQKAEWWNVIQFFYYAIFLSTIFIVQLVENLINNRNLLLKAFAAILILFAIPNSLDVIKQYAVFPGAAYVSSEEIAGLNFLKKQPKGVILTPLYDRSVRSDSGPNELFAYEDTAYISAFTDKPVYLADIHVLRISGIDYKDRLKRVTQKDCRILNEVDYIYEIYQMPKINSFATCRYFRIEKIFDNSKTIIFKIKKEKNN